MPSHTCSASDFIREAICSINFDSPVCKRTNHTGLQNRVIDLATELYMRSGSTESITPGFKAPSAYKVSDIALCEERARHYGVKVGEPTGNMLFDYSGTGLTSHEAAQLMIKIRAGAKWVIRSQVRATRSFLRS